MIGMLGRKINGPWVPAVVCNSHASLETCKRGRIGCFYTMLLERDRDKSRARELYRDNQVVISL